MFSNEFQALAMNLVFRALYAKSKLFHIFSLIASFKYKYCKPIFSIDKAMQKFMIKFRKVSRRNELHVS